MLLPACTSASGAAKPPARRTPVAVPSASPSPTDEVDVTPDAPRIDPEVGEQLGMAATSTMTISAGGKRTTHDLTQSSDADTVVEQNEGETQRVLRLSTADPKAKDDVQFSVDGSAAVGTFSTGEADLKVVFYHAKAGVDLLSDNGNCTVTFTAVGAAGVAGTVKCEAIETADGKAALTATFAAVATDNQ